jgi:hypothetical protein
MMVSLAGKNAVFGVSCHVVAVIVMMACNEELRKGFAY